MGSIESNNSTFAMIHPLSPLDHLSPRTHTTKLLYFASDGDPDTIVSHLRNALDQTIAALPIVAGSVGPYSQGTQRGSLAVQPPYFDADDLLQRRDLRQKYDYCSLRARDFPPDAVSMDLVAPILTNNANKVLVSQVNIIRGGIILVCAVHHCVMDECGIFKLIEIWAAYCRGTDGGALIHNSCLDRGPLMSGARGIGNLRDHPEYRLRTVADTVTGRKEPMTYVTDAEDMTGSAVLFFSDSALERLKKTASNGGAFDVHDETEEQISTNDALCALMWSAVTSARISPLDSEFIGNVVLITKSFLTFDKLTTPSLLSSVAAEIRRSVNEIDDSKIRDVLKAVQGVDDIGRLCPGIYSSGNANMGCTSWARMEYYELDWGKLLGGRLKRMRWRSSITDGIFALLPRIPRGHDDELGPGGIEVCLGLNQEHLNRLKEVDLIKEYADWRC